MTKLSNMKEQFNLNSILSVIALGALAWIGTNTASNNSRLAVVASIQEGYKLGFDRVQTDIETIKLKQQTFELQLLDFKNTLNKGRQ